MGKQVAARIGRGRVLARLGREGEINAWIGVSPLLLITEDGRPGEKGASCGSDGPSWRAEGRAGEIGAQGGRVR